MCLRLRGWSMGDVVLQAVEWLFVAWVCSVLMGGIALVLASVFAVIRDRLMQRGL